MARETTPLTGNAGRPGGQEAQARSRGNSSIRCNIICLAVLSAGLLAVSIVFQMKIRSLSVQLTTEKSHLSALSAQVDDQQSVIDRFSNAVSNKDVLEKVSLLEDSLHESEKELKHQLLSTQQSIEDLLNATLSKLDTTVKMAQDEIQEEVDKVKHDVNDYVIQTQDQFSMENSFMVYQLAGTFTLLASLISMWHMTAHLRRFNQPFVQRKILAILWMSPVYGLTSWLSLVFPAYEGYLAVIKDFFEAYVIYQFLSLLVAILGKGDRNAVVSLLAQHADHLKPPFRLFGCCLPNPYESPRSMADAVLLQCQTFTMQFVFFRPLTTIGIFVCDKKQYYGWGTSAADYRSPQFWLVMIQNLSVFVAFSGLLKFYHAVQEDLAWCRPLPKFLCIKSIVFLTFWQGLAIAIMANAIGDSTPNVGNDDPELWAKQAQNFLICLEMLLFSIAHFYCFPTEEWEEGYRPVVTESKFGDQLALHDFFQDLKLVARQGGKKKNGKNKGKKLVGKDGTPGDKNNENGGVSTEDESNINLSQVESQIAESLALPDTPENVREASLRLLQAMAFEPEASSDTSNNDVAPEASESSSPLHVREDDDEDNDDAAVSVALPTSSSSAVREVLDADVGQLDADEEIGQKIEEAPDEESNEIIINYDDDPTEETGLLASSRNIGVSFGANSNTNSHSSNDDRGGSIMGGGPDSSAPAETDSGGVLRPSLFTTLGKFS